MGPASLTAIFAAYSMHCRHHYSLKPAIRNDPVHLLRSLASCEADAQGPGNSTRECWHCLLEGFKLIADILQVKQDGVLVVTEVQDRSTPTTYIELRYRCDDSLCMNACSRYFASMTLHLLQQECVTKRRERGKGGRGRKSSRTPRGTRREPTRPLQLDFSLAGNPTRKLFSRQGAPTDNLPSGNPDWTPQIWSGATEKFVLGDNWVLCTIIEY
jgi:hypothetical protein